MNARSVIEAESLKQFLRAAKGTDAHLQAALTQAGYRQSPGRPLEWTRRRADYSEVPDSRDAYPVREQLVECPPEGGRLWLFSEWGPRLHFDVWQGRHQISWTQKFMTITELLTEMEAQGYLA